MSSKAIREGEIKRVDLEKSHHEPNILFWDIETTNLRATFGTILTIGWKWRGESAVHVRSILDRPKGKGKGHRGHEMLDDRYVVEEFVKVFNTADVHVTWYGEGFDLRMLRSKLILYGLPPIAPISHIDLWKTARRKFNVHSNRLVVWQEFLGVEHEKTPLKFEEWMRAAQGDKEALKYIIEHNKNDVLVLEDVYERMRPWVEQAPSLALITGDEGTCPACGSDHMSRQGHRVANTQVYQRYQCQDCGHWSRSRTSLGSTAMRSSIT